jgi:hypothetical protein
MRSSCGAASPAARTIYKRLSRGRLRRGEWARATTLCRVRVAAVLTAPWKTRVFMSRAQPRIATFADPLPPQQLVSGVDRARYPGPVGVEEYPQM